MQLPLVSEIMAEVEGIPLEQVDEKDADDGDSEDEDEELSDVVEHECKNPSTRSPFLCRLGFYISRPFCWYLIRTRIEKVSFSRYALRYIGYRIVRCHYF